MILFFQVPISPIENQPSSLLSTKRFILMEHQTTKPERILKLYSFLKTFTNYTKELPE